MVNVPIVSTSGGNTLMWRVNVNVITHTNTHSVNMTCEHKQAVQKAKDGIGIEQLAVGSCHSNQIWEKWFWK